MAVDPDAAAASSAPPTSRPIFAIFEGGGAKGVAHLGAYAAADELGLDFVGVAGASAGAIVAALIAVGFKPTEIFNPTAGGEDLFSLYDLSPIRLLGETDWRAFRCLRHWRWVALAGLSFLILGSVSFLLGWPFGLLISAAVLFILALLILLMAGWLIIERGVFDPAHFADAFNQVLHERVSAAYRDAQMSTANLPAKIRFRDIDPLQIKRFCRLKVVATDISGQQLRLFDHRTPDVVVAEAVAASIAIPGIFKPARILSDDAAAPARDYADGGLVSNLPVWCFSEEKAATERRTLNNAAVPIVAFSLVGTTAPLPASLSAWGYLWRVMRTGIFGGQLIVQEFVQDLYPIQLESTLGLLDFDVDRARAAADVEASKRRALQHLRQRLEFEPRAWGSQLESICAEVAALIGAHLEELGHPLRLRWRAAVFEPVRPLRGSVRPTFVTAYRVTHACHMEADCDDRLTLDKDCPGVPEAFEQASVTVWDPEQVSGRKAVMTKYERVLLRRSIRSVICVPVFQAAESWNLPAASRNPPVAVLSLDTDEAIIPAIKDAEPLLASIAEATLGLSSLLSETRLE